jgi:serine/threonine protein kinase
MDSLETCPVQVIIRLPRGYEFIEMVGKGGFGEVYRVKKRSDGEEFAMKRISLQNTADLDADDAYKEARLLKKLRHPNIVALYDVHKCDGALYIIMEWCENGDLAKRVKTAQDTGQPVPSETIMEWFEQLTSAVNVSLKCPINGPFRILRV